MKTVGCHMVQYVDNNLALCVYVKRSNCLSILMPFNKTNIFTEPTPSTRLYKSFCIDCPQKRFRSV